MRINAGSRSKQTSWSARTEARARSVSYWNNFDLDSITERNRTMRKTSFIFMAAFLSAGFIFAQANSTKESKPIEEKKITKDGVLVKFKPLHPSEKLIQDKIETLKHDIRIKDKFHHELLTKMAHVGLLHSVKGAPYSGDAVTETTQALPDGNRIYRKTRVSLYRDGEGRVRREEFRTVGQSSPAGETPETILIMDPRSEERRVGKECRSRW